ncbi:MAG TPA: class I SAM-dependent methyltransferase [Dongiaceae bacterium]|nr:class I SAM-dependent methyltransferase [Dongiaceae bacterium]
MPALSQTQFPRLWLLMQKTIGGNRSKQELVLRYYQKQPRILEIGCSVGNVSDAFRDYAEISYTGIDIDPNAIAVAKSRFHAHPNFTFELRSLADLAAQGQQFDYVIFAGILHHISDDIAATMLADAMRVVAPGGQIVISEPEALRPTDNLIFRLFYNLEQGQFLRSRQHLERLVAASGAKISQVEDHLISPGIVKVPFVARFNLLVATPSATG